MSDHELYGMCLSLETEALVNILALCESNCVHIACIGEIKTTVTGYMCPHATPPNVAEKFHMRLYAMLSSGKHLCTPTAKHTKSSVRVHSCARS